MALLSPGVQVTVTDKSMYLPAAATTVPLFFIATKYGKLLPNSNTVAKGTIEAGMPRLITSLRESIEMYGIPVFYRDVYDQPQHGDARNEYGLLALNQFLKLGNRAYVIRADIDLDDSIENLQDKWSLAIDKIVNSASAMFSTYLASVDDIDPAVVTNLGGFVTKPNLTGLSPALAAQAMTEYYANVVRVHDENAKLADIIKSAVTDLASITSTFGNQYPNSKMYNITDVLAGNYVDVENTVIEYDVNGASHEVYVYEAFAENVDPITTGKDTLYNLLVSSGARKIQGNIPTSASVLNPLPRETDTSLLFRGIVGKLHQAIIDETSLIGGTLLKYDAAQANVNFTSLPALTTIATQGSDNLVISGVIDTITPNMDPVTKQIVNYTCKTNFVLSGNTITTPLTGPTQSGTVVGTATGTILYTPATASTASSVETVGAIVFNLTVTIGASVTASKYTLTAGEDFLHKFTPVLSKDITLPITTALQTDLNVLAVGPTGTAVTLDLLATGAGANLVTGEVLSADEFIDPVSGDTLYRLHAKLSYAGTTSVEAIQSTAFSYGTFVYDDNQASPVCTLESTLVFEVSGATTSATITVKNSTANPSVEFLHDDNGTDTLELDTANTRLTINVDNKPKIAKTLVNPFSGIDLTAFKNLVRAGCEEFVKTYSWYNNTHPKGKSSVYTTSDAVRRQGIVLKLSQIIKANTTLNYNISSDFDDVSDITSEAYEFNLILCPGYPELADEMLELADRVKQEAFVIADTPYWMSPREVIQWGRSVDENTIVSTAANIRSDNRGMIAYYYPHGVVSNLDGYDVMCASSGLALAAFTYNDNVGHVWTAPGGPNRGIISSLVGVTQVGYVDAATLGTSQAVFHRVRLNDGMRDSLYNLCNINPIHDSEQHGIAVWGQKTRVNVAFNSSLDRINVARMVMHIRRGIRKMMMQYLMEANTDTVRKNIVSVISGYLNNIRVNNGLYDFAILCDETNNLPDSIDRNELYVEIALKPTKTIEFIYVPISLVKTGDPMTL